MQFEDNYFWKKCIILRNWFKHFIRIIFFFKRRERRKRLDEVYQFSFFFMSRYNSAIWKLYLEKMYYLHLVVRSWFKHFVQIIFLLEKKREREERGWMKFINFLFSSFCRDTILMQFRNNNFWKKMCIIYISSYVVDSNEFSFFLERGERGWTKFTNYQLSFHSSLSLSLDSQS